MTIDKYKIDCEDGLNVIVSKLVDYTANDGSKAVKWRLVGYYGKVEQGLRCVLNEMLKDGVQEAQTVERMLAKIDKIEKLIEEGVNDTRRSI